ncbi:MAG: PIN domain-containing protein [Betaproteobacteria bacterium]|nr:MAG: PIN domain-containing protein [Betaproteobacteria bacterium]
MILPDANVLIYAFRNDSPDHLRYRAWLESVVNFSEAYGMSPQVLAGVVRIVSHPRIFSRPSRVSEAFAFARTLIEQPNAILVVPGDRHWRIFEQLCAVAAATGNLVQDAWYAALAIESGCEWITTDRDYARFPDLRWRAP